MARLCGETSAAQRTVVWYRAMVINLVCGFVSAVCLGFSFYGTVRLSLYLETVARASASGTLMHGLTSLTVASFVVSMVGIYVSYVLYGRFGELRGGGLRPFALAYVACAACVALTVGTAFFVVSALLLPHIAHTRVRLLRDLGPSERKPTRTKEIFVLLRKNSFVLIGFVVLHFRFDGISL